MRGEYRFLKVRKGITYYAYVAVEVASSSDGSEVHDAIKSPVCRDAGEFDSHTCPQWVQAAMRGAAATLEILEKSEGKEMRYSIGILEVKGTLVDTSDDAVFCASALATLNAIEPGEGLWEPYFDECDKKWTFRKV